MFNSVNLNLCYTAKPQFGINQNSPSGGDNLSQEFYTVRRLQEELKEAGNKLALRKEAALEEKTFGQDKDKTPVTRKGVYNRLLQLNQRLSKNNGE